MQGRTFGEQKKAEKSREQKLEVYNARPNKNNAWPNKNNTGPNVYYIQKYKL